MVLSSEFLKLRKSKIIFIGTVYFVIMTAFMVYLMMRRETIEKYFEMFKLIETIVFVGGELGFGFITAWFFGREYTDHTVKDLLSLPFPRCFIILAKFMIIFLYFLLVSIIMFIIPYIAGSIAYPNMYTMNEILQYLQYHTVMTLIIILLNTPLAFIAVCSGGYLLSISFLVFAFIIGIIINNMGYGSLYPLMIPSIYIEQRKLEGVTWTILFLYSMSGLLATIGWWRFVDQKK
jgi:ABC-2 type transport system permease protein